MVHFTKSLLNVCGQCFWQSQLCVMCDKKLSIFSNVIVIKLFLLPTGSSFGLKLVINVEEYDYMPGPYHDSGIKVSLIF